jgi:hypothetical protein
MQKGDTKAFKRAVMIFCLVEAVLLAAMFGSYYLGRYGLSLAPFRQGQSGIWWTLYHDAAGAACGAVAAAVMVYLGGSRKRDEGKSKDAA